jgi:lipopolysaccharide transport system ATP-binding protein
MSSEMIRQASEVAIRVQSLTKRYEIYETPGARLKQFFAPRLAGILGRKPKQYFREFLALKDVSFEVKRGDVVGIIGRNGSGKSTLLQIICGTLTPSNGCVETHGRVAALLELGSGFNPEFSGRENVYLNAALLGLSKEQIDQRFEAISQFAEIGEHIDQPVKTYSSGMFVRLAFAVIVHVDADILIIDEALAVGDVFFTQKCMRFLRKFVEHGTILLVTHDTNTVMSFCSRAIWLDAGARRSMGTSKQVCEQYLAALYQSEPSEQTAPAVLPSANVEIIADSKDLRQEVVRDSALRNDLEVFKFQDGVESFGTNLVSLESVVLLSDDGKPLSWALGGELIELKVTARAHALLSCPIVGFVVKDKLGQTLFGDNTYLSFMQTPVSKQAMSTITARFRFRMPVMPTGDYTIAIGIAEGTQDSHTVHKWVHDALAFKSHSSSVTTGLLGIPMLSIHLE